MLPIDTYRLNGVTSIETNEIKFKRYKSYIIDSSYFVGFTGKQAFCYDSNFEFLGTVDKLRYVYNGDISPDAEKIILISNENKFSIHKLPDLELIYKVTVKSPYNGNLEGNACWSFDSKQILLCALNEETLNSSLKIFDFETRSFTEDYLKEKYWLIKILRVIEKGKYLLVGFNRKDLKTYIIWFDGKDFSEYLLSGFNDVVTSVKYNSVYDSVDICSENTILRYDCLGNTLPSNLSDLQKYSISETVLDVCFSKNLDIAYIGTLNGIYILDMKANQIIESFQVDYGVHKITEISHNKIIVSTWNGVRIFEYAKT